jgi:hypothetical protein
MSRRPNVLSAPGLLVEVARDAARECPPGHAQALRALGSLAIVKVPSRGILWAPGDAVEEDLYSGIRLVAERYLGAAKANAAWRRALDAIDAKTTFEELNAVEGAVLHANWLSQTAHFYAGVAFGVTFTDAMVRR